MTVRRPPLTTAIRGFYAVLDREDEALARMLLRVSRVLQVRIKPRGERVDTATILRVARMARRVCDELGAALVVNDRIDVALAASADGVHLGQTDVPLVDARKLVGNQLWIGISTHDLEQVRCACDGGADYLGFGPMFATSTKENPDPVQGLEGLRRAVAASRVPVVAIGGVTAAHARAIYDAGAAAICAISAVNTSPNVEAAAQALHGA